MIKRFNLVNNAEELINNQKYMRKGNASFIHKDVTRWIVRTLKNDITLFVGFPDDLSIWNDFDFVLVMDDSFGQPYTPFYNLLSGESKGFAFLNEVVEKYNEIMESFTFLKEVTE